MPGSQWGGKMTFSSSSSGEGSGDGLAEIDARVDEAAVEIEDDEADYGRATHLLTTIDRRAVSSVPGTRGEDARFDWT